MPQVTTSLQVPNYASAPATGLAKGQLYFNTTSNSFFYYDGTAWQSVGSGTGTGNVSNSGTPSANQLAVWTDATHIQGVADTTKQWDGGSTGLTAATGRTSLGLVIGTNVQAWDTDLDTWAGVTPATGVGAFLATPNSANLRSALTDENGTGAALFNSATQPDFTTGLTIGGAGTSGKILKGDGTRYAPSTETYAAPGTAGNTMVSDGTNWTSKPDWFNASTVVQASGFSSNQYLTGSLITIAAGSMTVGSIYRCVFDMVKTAAGVAPLQLNVHMGTTGTTADAAVQNITFGSAQTNATDQARFEVWITFRAVGASAVIVTMLNMNRFNNTATGFISSTIQVLPGAGVASSAFSSTAVTKIGIGFNGGASFLGTCQLVQTEYRQA